MAWCGCKERGEAIVAGMKAIASGDKVALAEATAKFTRTVREDAGALQRAAKARLSLGRR